MRIGWNAAGLAAFAWAARHIPGRLNDIMADGAVIIAEHALAHDSRGLAEYDSDTERYSTRERAAHTDQGDHK